MSHEPSGNIKHFCPENGTTSAQIHNRRDHVASCVKVVFQLEIGTPAVISSYYDKTPLLVRKRICATDFLDTSYISRDN